jgi:flagellar biosynthetic protein FlhB
MTEDQDRGRHSASPTRIRNAQSAGNIPISRELATSLAWMGGLAVLLALGHGLWTAMQSMTLSGLVRFDPSTSASEVVLAAFARFQALAWQSLAPILAVIAVIGAVSFGLQTRFAVFPEQMGADFSRINPLVNIRNLAGLPTWASAAFGFAKLVALTATAAWIVISDPGSLVALGGLDLQSGVDQTALWVADALLKLCAGAAVAGMADYGLRWWHHRYRLRMTDQEIRDERRAMEPSPEIEARRRLMQRQQ